MKATSVGSYAQPVPTCCLSDRVQDVLKRFNPATGDRLVVVNTDREPIGLLAGRTLMPLMKATQLQASVVLGLSLDSLMHIAIRTGRSPLTPLITVPHHCSLQQARAQVQSQLALVDQPTKTAADATAEWGVVDGQGRYLGLLNWRDLWPRWMTPDASSDEVASLAPDILQTLLATLGRLPLPLMVQTQSGEILLQNSEWHNLMGELQHPAQVAEQVAAAFKDSGKADCPPSPSSVSQTVGDPVGVRSETARQMSPAADSVADVCVCRCPSQTNPENICEFTKIWLGEQAIASLPAAIVPNTVGRGIQPDEFRLAPLVPSVPTHPPPASKRATATLRPSQGGHTDNLWLVLAQTVTEPERISRQVSRELAAKNADLTQLNRLKDEFLACISHELKTPLTAVLGLSELLRDSSLGALNERQSRYAHLIYQSGRRLVSVVNDILDLTRIETGQLRLTPKSITIRSLCAGAYQHLQTLHVDSEVALPGESLPSSKVAKPAFHLDIQPNLETIVADELRLRQMLIHLLSNALKFTDPSGEVGIRVEQWENWIAFTVWDTGIGIPPSKQHLIFQKFQQLEQPMTRQFEGTGLGLVLTQRLARLHGGDVTFVSTENEGSEFTLLLPPSPPRSVVEPDDWQEALSAPVVNCLPKSSNRLILAAEADQAALNQLTQHLADLSYRVAIARSGMDALGKIRRLQPRAVLLNPMLPLLSGWDVLTLLKADACTRSIPVIITATPLEEEAAADQGADGFLSLPLDPGSLEKTLDRLVGVDQAKPQRQSPLTVLYLNPSPSPQWAATDGMGDGWAKAPISTSPPPEQPDTSQKLDLNRFLHPHFCRVLEVNDLDQAELLTRVWKPNLILLSNALAEPTAYLKDLSQRCCLRALPIVTLTPAITEAAYQAGLFTFPCLMATAELERGHAACPDNSSLLQVLHIAAGIGQTRHVLIADTALTDSGSGDRPSPTALQPASLGHASDSVTRHLQISAQYLQAAGLNCSIAQTWPDVLRQLEHQTIDLLLLHLNLHRHPLTLYPIIQALSPWRAQIPIVVWPAAYPLWQDDPEAPLLLKTLQPDLEAIATCVLPPFASLDDVLTALQQLLQ